MKIFNIYLITATWVIGILLLFDSISINLMQRSIQIFIFDDRISQNIGQTFLCGGH